MAQIDLTFIHVDGNTEIDTELSDTLTCGQIIQLLIDVNFIPPLGDGADKYALTIKGGRTITSDETLASAGVVSGNSIRVGTPPRGGGSPWMDLLAVAASLSSIIQVVLMVADLWSKKAKEKDVTRARKSVSTESDEVKKIRIQMSDGTQVEFESWLTDSEKLKQFIKTFSSPSQSPKPLSVRFYLKNRSGATLNLSNTPV